MIRRIIATTIIAAMCAYAVANAANPYGLWKRGDGNAVVRIAPCGDKVCATNVWIKDTSEGEEVGDRLIMTLERKSDTKLAGAAYDPKRGKTYSITVIIREDSLVTRGCILWGLLCTNVEWTPAQLSLFPHEMSLGEGPVSKMR